MAAVSFRCGDEIAPAKEHQAARVRDPWLAAGGGQRLGMRRPPEGAPFSRGDSDRSLSYPADLRLTSVEWRRAAAIPPLPHPRALGLLFRWVPAAPKSVYIDPEN